MTGHSKAKKKRRKAYLDRIKPQVTPEHRKFLMSLHSQEKINYFDRYDERARSNPIVTRLVTWKLVATLVDREDIFYNPPQSILRLTERGRQLIEDMAWDVEEALRRGEE